MQTGGWQEILFIMGGMNGNNMISNIRKFLFPIIICLSSCAQSQQNLVEKIKGTWVGCDDGGTYMEIHFSEYESLYINADIISLAYPVPYSILENKVHYTNVRLQKTFIDTLYLEGDFLTLRSRDYTYKLQRINDVPVLPLESRSLGGNLSLSDSILYVHYQRMFLMREAEYKCEGN